MIRLINVMAALLIVLAQPALALSCMAPDIARDYARAAQSGDVFIIVKGELFFDEAALSKSLDQRGSAQRDTRDIEGWLAGQSLAPDGFTKPFERDVILRVSCLGPWCGGTVKGPHLTFLRQEDRNWIMEIGPCPGMTYVDPTKAQLQKVRACFRGEDCTVK